MRENATVFLKEESSYMRGIRTLFERVTHSSLISIIHIMQDILESIKNPLFHNLYI